MKIEQKEGINSQRSIITDKVLHFAVVLEQSMMILVHVSKVVLNAVLKGVAFVAIQEYF